MIQKAKTAAKNAEKPKYIKDFGDLRDCDFTELGSIYLQISLGKYIFEFRLDLAEDPHCCGLSSVGDFRILRNSDNIPEKEKINLIKEAFEKLIDLAKFGNKEYTLFLTLVKNKECNYIKEALKDGTLFTLVKSFVNANSGNVNDFYVSN